MSGSSPFPRSPLVINGNSLSSGDRTARFAVGSPESLLRSYLIFVRDLRGQGREPSIELRSADIAVLARHLGVTQEVVLGGLLDLMGATRAQRSSMLALLAAGALTIVLSGTIVSSLSTDGVSVGMERLADAVHAAVSESDGQPVAARVQATGIRTTTESTVDDAGDGAGDDAGDGAGDDAGDEFGAAIEPGVLAASTPTPDVLRSIAVAPRGESIGTPGDTSGPDTVGPGPVSIGVTGDGALVASVAPPVPPTPTDDQTATAELPDGTTVGVAAPPVPPTPTDDQTATAQLPDGTTVGVAAPPVPPTPTDDQTATAQLPDGTTVGVAAPPVPPEG